MNNKSHLLYLRTMYIHLTVFSPPLHGTVSFEQVNGIARSIREHLHLDMARLGNIPVSGRGGRHRRRGLWRATVDDAARGHTWPYIDRLS